MTFSLWRTVLQSPLPPIVGRLAAPVVSRQTVGRSGVPLVDAIDSLIGPMPRAQAAAIARAVVVNEIRNACLRRMCRVGRRSASVPVIRWSGADRLLDLHANRSPAIVATWHFGADLRIGMALGQLGIPALVFRGPADDPGPESAGIQYLVVKDPAQRGLMLKRALTHLKRGGVVAIAIDGLRTERPIDVPFLGRRIEMGHGAATLSRLSGAPILPVVKTWAANGIEVGCADPIRRPEVGVRDTQDFDRALTLEIARWFERAIRSAPEHLRPKNLSRYLRAPRLETGPSSVAHDETSRASQRSSDRRSRRA